MFFSRKSRERLITIKHNVNDIDLKLDKELPALHNKLSALDKKLCFLNNKLSIIEKNLNLYLSSVQKSEEQLSNIKDKVDNIAFHSFNGFYILKEVFKNQILSFCDSINTPHETGIYPQLNATVPYAKNSNDYLFPESTMDGAIRKPRFTKKIKSLFPNCRLLDIGCGGGGIVFDALMNGIIACGIDGSNQNKKLSSGYWAIDKNCFFTCDATKPYHFTINNKKFLFNIICSWECLEHIPENLVQGFLNNVHENLSDNGFFIGSISKMPYFNEKTGVVYHCTIKERKWWEKQFLMANLEMIEIENSPFEYTDFCRGIGIDWQDMHTNYIDHPEDGILFISKKVTSCM